MEGSSDEECGGDLESVGGELSGSGVWGVDMFVRVYLYVCE